MPETPPWVLRLYSTEERLERAERALRAFWEKLEQLGWRHSAGSAANWVEQALAWIEGRGREQVQQLPLDPDLQTRLREKIESILNATFKAMANYIEQLEASSSERIAQDFLWGWCSECERVYPTRRNGHPCPICETKLTPNPKAPLPREPQQPQQPPTDAPVQFYCRLCLHYEPIAGSADEGLCGLKQTGTPANGTCSEWRMSKCTCPRHPETGQLVGYHGACAVHTCPGPAICATCAHRASSKHGMCYKGLEGGRRSALEPCPEWRPRTCSCIYDPGTHQLVKKDSQCSMHGDQV